jgi:hypothetical protein
MSDLENHLNFVLSEVETQIENLCDADYIDATTRDVLFAMIQQRHADLTPRCQSCKTGDANAHHPLCSLSAAPLGTSLPETADDGYELRKAEYRRIIAGAEEAIKRLGGKVTRPDCPHKTVGGDKWDMPRHYTVKGEVVMWRPEFCPDCGEKLGERNA